MIAIAISAIFLCTRPASPLLGVPSANLPHYYPAILIAGCTTTGLKDVYILSLSYQPIASISPSASQLNPSLSTTFARLAGNTTTLEVRAGYIGMCISATAGNWTCSRDADSLARTLNLTQSATSPDPLNILWIAKTFRDTIVFDGLMSASPSPRLSC